MTYDKIKTIILTILVITSAVLTWSIWTYQPNYDKLEKEKTVPEVKISDVRDVKDIIKPDKVFHHQKNVHFGTVEKKEIDNIIKEISSWSFADFEKVPHKGENLDHLIYEQENSEIVFPEKVPMEIYRNILGIKDKQARSINFDRIVIDLENFSKDYGYVYFLLSESDEAFRCRVKYSFIANFKDRYFQKAAENKNFRKYDLDSVTKGKKILVLADQITLPIYNYLMDVIPTEKFRDALFSDPNFVKKNITLSGEEYTSSSTLLSVNKNTHMILYVNPAEENHNQSGNLNNLLEKSIEFVNGHGGWTGDYRYVDIHEEEKTVLFRLYHSSGYPIFSGNGISEIMEIWGESDINEYLRNNFTLERLVESKETKLISGTEALDLLKKQKDFNPEFLQDLTLAYKMSQDSEGPLIHLEPTWFYLYQDQWLVVPTGSRGGLNGGLE